MASTKPRSRKRLNLGEDDEDDEQDTTATTTGAASAGTAVKFQKTAKKRVNPFKSASANTKPKVSSLPLSPSSNSQTQASSSPVPPKPIKTTSSSTQTPEPSTKNDQPTSTSTAQDDEDEEEDDYLSMSLSTLPQTSTAPETYTQRRLRLARESEARARVPSKAELAQQEKQRREEGLKRSLLEDKNSKGYKMMKAMGWKGEGGLGKLAQEPPAQAQSQPADGTAEASKEEEADEEEGNEDGDLETPRPGLGLTTATTTTQPRGPILEPIALSIKEDRSGIGHLTSERLKFRESLNRSGIPPAPETHPQESAESYRTRIRLDREEKRAEAQFYAAQNILEGFDRGSEKPPSIQEETYPKTRHLSPLGTGPRHHHHQTSKDTSLLPRTTPLKSIPLLYRSLIKHREEKDRARRARYDFMESLSSVTHSTSKPLNLPGYDRDLDEKHMFGTTQMVEEEGDAEEEDEELEEFNQLPFTERLGMIVKELREEWKYCFWCKYRYANQEEMDESCPGLDEDLHG